MNSRYVSTFLTGCVSISLLTLIACASPTPPTSSTSELPDTATITRTSQPRLDLTSFPQEPRSTYTPVPTGTKTPTPPPSPLPPTSESVPGWLVFRNEDYQYEFSYPPTAKIITEGVNSFPTDEQPPNMSFEEYIAQLQETYPGALCVSLIHNIGFINISAPPNETSKYTLCGGFGVGDYDITPVVETVFVGDTSYSSKGYQIHERDAQATLRDEFYFVELENGTNISYGGSWLDQGATYEEYMKIKEDLLRILASYEILVPWGNENIPTRTPGPTPTALFLQSGDDEAACIKPEGLPGEIAVIYYPFCIFWAESLEDEKGFEIVIEYADVEKLYELFVFQTGPNATSLLIPEEYAPRLDESREQCLRRKSFVLKLYTLQEDEKKYFTELAQESECNLPNLPTATPEP